MFCSICISIWVFLFVACIIALQASDGGGGEGGRSRTSSASGLALGTFFGAILTEMTTNQQLIDRRYKLNQWNELQLVFTIIIRTIGTNEIIRTRGTNEILSLMITSI